jgi:hypothetical protein
LFFCFFCSFVSFSFCFCARNKALIVAALAPRLAAVPADLLLDLLRQEPHLSRIDEFTKLVLEPRGCNRERRHYAPDPLWAYAADL